jgi:hypothetical protein
MGGFFGVASKEDCVFDLFYGTDYHSHLGTRRAGMAVYSEENGFDKAIHNIENSPFRTKFTSEANTMQGTLGIGCISDFEAQPILVRSHHGTFAITTIGKINNIDEISHLIIDIEGVHPVKWPKSIISCVDMSSTAGVTSYDDEYLEKQGLDYNLHNFAGLTTMELIIPEYFITENMNLISIRSKSDITINENDLPYEWKNLDLIFSTKSFDKLYVFKPTTWDKFYEVKKIGKSFIIKHRSTNLMKKYQF